ncbi:Aste57867_5053 [Aphanomyces stellatus]|uniref:Aste57867_5053 protein n=1 Tax=Aphanomyces stellatus TaxID=120398 RepID=A0A485KEV8_9STRA|nr:hypothetical protein As57867_005040 [Aphanomyces stellatus]VFT82134.1 Aste57867_5053 [Aphanomyces stellatus]
MSSGLFAELLGSVKLKKGRDPSPECTLPAAVDDEDRLPTTPSLSRIQEADEQSDSFADLARHLEDNLSLPSPVAASAVVMPFPHPTPETPSVTNDAPYIKDPTQLIVPSWGKDEPVKTNSMPPTLIALVAPLISFESPPPSPTSKQPALDEPIPPTNTLEAIINNVDMSQPLLPQVAPTAAPSTASLHRLKLFPTIIHKMLDEVRIDSARFYIPLEHVNTQVLRHIQRVLASFVKETPPRKPKLGLLSCLLGVETVLNWLARFPAADVQGWMQDALDDRRRDELLPSGPTQLTAANFSHVVLAAQARVRMTPVPETKPDNLDDQSSLSASNEVGYNRYLEAVYSPRKTTLTTLPRSGKDTSAVAPQSPRRGLHVLISEHIYRHEYRPVSKHIPQFSAKKGSVDLSLVARRKRATQYGNHKGKATTSSSSNS